MDRTNPEESEPQKEELLNNLKREGGRAAESQEENRRGVLKVATLSVLSALGLTQTTNTTAAIPGESVNVDRNEAHEVIQEYRDRLNHLSRHGILSEVDVDSLVAAAGNEPSDSDAVQAEVIRGPEGDTEPALKATTRGPKGKVKMWFPLNSNYALFDLPDSVDSDALSENWNDRVASQNNTDDDVDALSCPDCNDGCCCNVCSCDNCHCTNWGYCDCTNVAGTECWYRHCDCCPDAVNYCTRYCGAPLSTNC